jgi:ParB/RepB/Spo0J family partition protein
MNVQEISLGEICSSPKNPRRHEDKKKLEELAASIKQKGVIEPIIVRTAGKGAKIHFEIVAGERRWKAAAMAGLAKIPCLIRDLSDDEAYDFMLIENLQREDLTDSEEAQSFRAYVDLHGDEAAAIATLAEKTSISPGYIRSRLRILTLPSKVLKLFDKGELLFGHLQQLLRVADDKKTLDEAIEWVYEDMGWGDKRLPSVKETRSYIDDLAPALSSAFFPTADVCGKCASNSTVQKTLFDLAGAGPGLCLRPSCFKKCQAAFLDENWKSTDLAKRLKTNGYRFAEDSGGQHHSFYSYPIGKKCLACDKLVTIIEIGGKVHGERVCAGDLACFNLVRNPRSEKERETAERDPAAPRASWLPGRLPVEADPGGPGQGRPARPEDQDAPPRVRHPRPQERGRRPARARGLDPRGAYRQGDESLQGHDPEDRPLRPARRADELERLRNQGPADRG